MLLRHLYIDVNDPRNQTVIKLLREQKNDFLKRLLDQDSKNLLTECQPFRHKLLQARVFDSHTYGQQFIPMLESELIESWRSEVYLDLLESLFKKDAFKAHQDRKIAAEQEGADPADAAFDDPLGLGDQREAEQVRRVQAIFEKIKNRVNNATEEAG